MKIAHTFAFPVSYLIEGLKINRPSERKCDMQTLGIRISKQKVNGGVLSCRRVTVREKLLRFLLGAPIKLTVLVPGDTVSEVTIKKKKKNDEYNERDIGTA